MKIRSLVLAAVAAFALTPAFAQTVTVMGSTALGPLVKQAADEYMKAHPGVQIAVSGGGSMTGLNQVVSGGCTIGISDVFATPAQDKTGIRNYDLVIEPFTLIANPGVGVSSLTPQQAEDVWTGKINNWKEVGGANVRIVRINRPTSSGTRAVLQNTVLHGKPFSDNQLIQDASGTVAKMVASTPGAISFIELEFLDLYKGRIRGIAYNGAVCDKQGVGSGKYTLISFGHAYVNPGKTNPQVLKVAEDFLKFILSPQFQGTTVLKAGYMPVSYVQHLKARL